MQFQLVLSSSLGHGVVLIFSSKSLVAASKALRGARNCLSATTNMPTVAGGPYLATRPASPRSGYMGETPPSMTPEPASPSPHLPAAWGDHRQSSHGILWRRRPGISSRGSCWDLGSSARSRRHLPRPSVGLLLVGSKLVARDRMVLRRGRRTSSSRASLDLCPYKSADMCAACCWTPWWPTTMMLMVVVLVLFLLHGNVLQDRSSSI